ITLRTTGRILRQLRHDPRTIALLLVVPALLLTLMRYVFDSQPMIFNRVGVIMLGVFPFIAMFLVTSVAMLRERTTGTLERLLTTPLHKLDLLLGYGLAFALAALIQVREHCSPTTTMWRDVTIVVGCILLALLGGAATLRRRTA